MCLYVNKNKTINNKPKTAKTYFKVVLCHKDDQKVKAPYQNDIIESGWYKSDDKEKNIKPENKFSISGGAIHVFCTRSAAEKAIKNYNGTRSIIEVKCYPEDFIAFGSSSTNSQKSSPQAAYKKIFIQEDDLRNIIRNKNRKR